MNAHVLTHTHINLNHNSSNLTSTSSSSRMNKHVEVEHSGEPRKANLPSWAKSSDPVSSRLCLGWLYEYPFWISDRFFGRFMDWCVSWGVRVAPCFDRGVPGKDARKISMELNIHKCFKFAGCKRSQSSRSESSLSLSSPLSCLQFENYLSMPVLYQEDQIL